MLLVFYLIFNMNSSFASIIECDLLKSGDQLTSYLVNGSVVKDLNVSKALDKKVRGMNFSLENRKLTLFANNKERELDCEVDESLGEYFVASCEFEVGHGAKAIFSREKNSSGIFYYVKLYHLVSKISDLEINMQSKCLVRY